MELILDAMMLEALPYHTDQWYSTFLQPDRLGWNFMDVKELWNTAPREVIWDLLSKAFPNLNLRSRPNVLSEPLMIQLLGERRATYKQQYGKSIEEACTWA